jgi:hypothetical protein
MDECDDMTPSDSAPQIPHGSSAPTPNAPRTRVLPCDRCGYDLRGRQVGESCPECGWTIDCAIPAWWDDALLARMAFWARFAAIPCWVLLLVPLHFLFVISGSDFVGQLERTFWLFVVLMSMQVVAQLLAMLVVEDRRFGSRRSLALLWASMARAAAFGLAALLVFVVQLLQTDELMVPVYIAYFTLPLIAVGADIVTVRVFAQLRREVRPLLGARRSTRGTIARVALWIVYPLIMVPILGWYFAPIIWTISLALCFGELRRTAIASRTALHAFQ